jgi:multiple sugar transport system ATP-binding protein
MTMGDRIAVLSLGVLQQLATPQQLYDTPANKFVAGFIGSPSMNFIDVSIEGGGEQLVLVHPGFRITIPESRAGGLREYIGKSVTMGIRPEHIVERSLVPGQVPDSALIPATVDVVELLGNEIFVYLDIRGQTLTARMDPTLKLERGQQIEVIALPEHLHFFDPQTEQTIKA